MLEEETINYFRYEGARFLLSAFRHHLPGLPEERTLALEPALRSLWLAGERGGRTLYEVAAEVRLIADTLQPGRDTGAVLPDDVREMVAGWPTDEPWSVLHAVATHVESWKSGFVTKLSQAIPTSQELAHRFPQLREFLSNYYGQDGIATEDEMTEAEGLQLFIEECHRHPICLWTLPPVVAECSEALAIFQNENSLRRFFEDEHGLGSGTLTWADWLPLIAETFTAHMRAEHPPTWASA
ncbi:hypothetical protein J2Z21_003767 [Streptomyces griseochromogenes]|uniref:CdiI immunity protein domain-containing protein n=1 Tax=Streptomyces griseochromogenes TaxID=68214 RepID=A0A1B1ANW2_9ACTN|nr:hypothetical protein [Streptomyces griseochromogenes]ANP48252.1 hypothetical protein AVL59_00520 [Streptomyces griseochromogenes]MBP2050817.1 hypothetical protein [Streptomyces griseochromogenes]